MYTFIIFSSYVDCFQLGPFFLASSESSRKGLADERSMVFGGEQAPIITPRGGSQVLGWSSAESHRDKHAMLRASSLTGERPPRQGPLSLTRGPPLASRGEKPPCTFFPLFPITSAPKELPQRGRDVSATKSWLPYLTPRGQERENFPSDMNLKFQKL